MRVSYVTRGGPHLASYRLRIGAIREYLLGHGVQVVVGDWKPADVHVYSKHWNYAELEMARRDAGAIFDVCDDHFGNQHGDYYRAMCRVCRVVVSSVRLGERVREEVGKDATYIPEGWELPAGVTKEPGREPVGLWFGHASNYGELWRLWPKPTVPLIICTNAEGPGIVTYSLGALQRCLAECDFVVIPQGRDWKSANRMVESLHAGRFVVASDIPAYRGFDQYLGDIGEGVEWVKQNAGHITPRIISGRNALSSFHPESVGKMWLDCISDVATNGSGATST